MRRVGGEMEAKRGEAFSYMTDSGRSSLRLILRSGLKSKRFLVPDFLCKVILDVLDEAGVSYSFYGIKDDLSIDKKTISGGKFDVFYSINYFGQRNKIPAQVTGDKIVIEDYAFSPLLPERPSGVKRWVTFNSLRKISPLADGSLLRSSFELSGGLVKKQEPPFSKLKYDAKEIKYKYLFEHKFSENRYLALFKKAEGLLDRQKEIYGISGRSLFGLLDFYANLDREYSIRRRNFEALRDCLKRDSINAVKDYHSFFVLTVDKRDELREYLFSKKTFLPVHWPRIEGLENGLYDRAISIPVDSRYSRGDMAGVARLINGFYK